MISFGNTVSAIAPGPATNKNSTLKVIRYLRRLQWRICLKCWTISLREKNTTTICGTRPENRKFLTKQKTDKSVWFRYLYCMKESETKSRILQVTTRLFYEQGYNSTGINQIIEEAGIARASLYHHFPSKRDLLTAYLEEMGQQFTSGLTAFLAPLKDAQRKVAGLFDFLIERQYRTSFGGCHIMKISSEVEKTDTAAFSLAAIQKAHLKQLVFTQVAQLPVKEHQVLQKELLAETLFLLMEGALINSTIQKSIQPLKQARKAAIKLL